MQQINRLFEIVYILLDKKTVTARELAERFEVSTRTILRDIDTLSLTGIPVYTIQGKGGGISIMDHFVLNKSVISEEEQNEILFALKSMRAVRSMDMEHTLDKLQSLFKKGKTDWIDIDFSNWGSPATERQNFNLLKQAVLKKQVIEFEYLNRYGQRRHRKVEPLCIAFKSHSWYLQGFCLEKQDYRIYKLTRMREVKVCEEYFDRELLQSEEIDINVDGSGFTCVELKFAPEAAYRVYDEFDEQRIIVNEDGSLTASADYPYDEWVVGHILSFGDYAEVLKPDFVRKDIAERAKNIANKYK